MLTLEGLIAVIALCLTCFALGYTFGKDSTQKRRQDLVSLATFFVDKILPGHRYRQHPFYIQMITFENDVVNSFKQWLNLFAITKYKQSNGQI